MHQQQQSSAGDAASAGEASRSEFAHTEVVHTTGGHRQHYYVLYRQPGDAVPAADGLAPPPHYAGGSSRSPSTSPPYHSLRLVTQRRDTASTDVSSIDPSATESAPPPLPRAPADEAEPRELRLHHKRVLAAAQSFAARAEHFQHEG
jgi:hypothetical protein